MKFKKIQKSTTNYIFFYMLARINFGPAEPQTRFRWVRMGSREYLEHSCGLLQCLDCHDLVDKAGVRGGCSTHGAE